jgi:hypothetical protein
MKHSAKFLAHETRDGHAHLRIHVACATQTNESSRNAEISSQINQQLILLAGGIGPCRCHPRPKKDQKITKRKAVTSKVVIKH